MSQKNLIIVFIVIFSFLFCSKSFAQENTNKEEWSENPNASKLFFAPTAFSLKQGKGYIQSTDIIFVSGNYGLTDKFSIGGLGFYLPAPRDSPKMFLLNSKFSISFPKNIN